MMFRPVGFLGRTLTSYFHSLAGQQQGQISLKCGNDNRWINLDEHLDGTEIKDSGLEPGKKKNLHFYCFSEIER